MAKKKSYSAKDLDDFRKQLLAKREALFKSVGYLKESSMDTSINEYSGNHSTYSYHMADQGTDSQEREKAFFFAHREGRYLDHLERALERIGKKDFGQCIECGNLISKVRLEAVPHARLCIECKSKEEDKR
ncbi:MAG: TraR/DksA C4-type zinc finger protein [FCB group bacterium]|nr:TraR/DksA C4-type zinc finger protein [FCB group bacterium]